MFNGLAEKAANHSESAAPDSTQNTRIETQGAQGDLAPEMELQNNDQDRQPQMSHAQKNPGEMPGQSSKQDIVDLSKLQKFLWEGKEVTAEDLKKATMWQKDYTQKTMELSQQRKDWEADQQFRDNYHIDALKVIQDPQSYLKAFLETYPAKYHTAVLNQIERMSANLEGQTQAQGNPSKTSPEYIQWIKEQREIKESINAIKQEREQERMKVWDTQMDALETKFSSKYPKGNLASAYSVLQSYCEQNGINFQNVKPGQIETLFEKAMKDSHEQTEKQYQAWSQEQAKKQIEANKKGSDIGRGGGTPNQAPQKFKKLSDVQEKMIADMNS